MHTINRSFILLFAAVLLSTPLSAIAEDKVNVFIQGGHSGAWYDPLQPGHGLFLEVLEDTHSATGKQVFAAWFAYFEGRQVWLIGQGGVVAAENGGFEAVLEVSIFSGNDFPPRYDPDSREAQDWGRIVLRFSGCDQAHLSWESELPGYGSGELNLRRLTAIADSVCVPDLGGEARADDHGNTWPTATLLDDIGPNPRVIEARLETRGDVDVFLFTVPERVQILLNTVGPGDTDTVGILYRIEHSEEREVARDDDSSLFGGFQIEMQIPAGTYSVHISGKDDLEAGPYNFYYAAD